MQKFYALTSRLKTAGILESDSEEVRLQKSLLIFATGLICLASMLWLFIYWQLGPQLSSTIPFAFQLLLVGNLALYLKTLNFNVFRHLQLAFLLFMPFVAQWSMGNFINSSGISLWGLLAPVGAILCIGPKESIAWFVAYLFLTLLSGSFDYYLADSFFSAQVKISTATSIVFFALNFAAISSILFLLLRYAALERQKANDRLEEANKLLTIEQDKSEKLLLNILPGPIAERLKHSDQTIADGFQDVSVMFVDIVNFTRIAEGLTPQQVFSMLNRVFSAFDELAEQHGLEKIKTIGDAYMVAGGLNDCCDNYTEALVDLGLAMQAQLQTNFRASDPHLSVRIGIGTGPVVAGVVGKKKFIYDLWGDTVNLASRITTEGLPDVVQVDETTYQRLKHHYNFHPPMHVYLKGKGDMPIYRVVEKLNI